MAGKPRKLHLSPVQREILWLLEEAGEEEFPMLMNMLRHKVAHGSAAEFLDLTQHSVRGLWKAGFLTFGQDLEKPGAPIVGLQATDIQRVLSLANVVRWDETHGCWTWSDPETGPRRVLFVLTKRGEEAIRS